MKIVFGTSSSLLRMGSMALAFDGLLRDGRHALRAMRQNPGFSAAAILSLALGIGANTAIFSLVNAVLIRPLVYPQSEFLVGVFNAGVIEGEAFNDIALGPGLYAALKQHSAAVEQFGVWSSGTATVTGNGDPEQIKVVRMTREVLPALRVQPQFGRAFSDEDDSTGTPETVILSYSYWQRRFGGDQRVLLRQVTIDSVPRQVVGVMPRTFRFLDLAPDVLLPQRFAKANLPFEPFWYSGIARLKPGMTIDRANADVARILNATVPENLRSFLQQARVRPNLRPLKQDVTGNVSAVLSVLTGSLGLVFLLVCANVANLVLARTQARSQEFAIRAALGADGEELRASCWWRV